MTLLLAILIAYSILVTLVALWLWWSRRDERRTHLQIVTGWFTAALQREQEIAALREHVNQQRRNTGKAEV